MDIVEKSTGLGYQNPPRHPSKAGVEKLSAQPNKALSLDMRFEPRLGRLGFPGVGG